MCIRDRLYGYSLNIRDIDPTYTIGDLERKKREILAQLEADGVIDMNRELEFPVSVSYTHLDVYKRQVLIYANQK